MKLVRLSPLQRHSPSAAVEIRELRSEEWLAFQLLPPLRKALVFDDPAACPQSLEEESRENLALSDALVSFRREPRQRSHGAFVYLRRPFDEREPTPSQPSSDERWQGFITTDSRSWRLGHRLYVRPPEAKAEVPSEAAPSRTTLRESASASRGYELYRHLAGVCEGPGEVGVAAHLPFALNLDWLHFTCASNKGCFVGQEILTRALHQLSNRRRLAVLIRGRRKEEPLSETAAAEETSSRRRWAVAVAERAALLERFLLGGVDAASGTSEAKAGLKVFSKSEGGGRPSSRWREVGSVVSLDEALGLGVCVLRSPPSDLPLKEPTVRSPISRTERA